MILFLVGASCRTPDEDPLLAFPTEPQPGQFHGLSYPASTVEELAAPTRPLWLIAVDGASWDLLDPLLESGQLPHLASLIDRGARGTLVSEEPTISPALWATIATGTPRFVHGILNFVEKRPGQWRGETAGPLHRMTPAIWEHVGAAGGRSSVIGWFGSYPAEPIAGIYLSRGFEPGRIEPLQVHPPALVGRFDEWAMDTTIPDTSEFIARSMREDARNVLALRSLPEADSADLVAVYLSVIDVAQHVEWRYMDPGSDVFPGSSTTQSDRADRIATAYRFVDGLIGQLLERMPDEANLLLVSDHGAGPLRLQEAFHLQLEILLQDVGLMDADAPEEGDAWALSAPYRHDKRIWVTRDDTRADELSDRLRSMTTDLGEPIFESIIDHSAQSGWTPDAPALTVRFSPQALVARQVADGDTTHDFSPVRMRHEDVSGSHRLEGIVVAAGPDIVAGKIQRPLTLYNIAPTALYLLGLPQDRRMLRWAPADGGVAEALVLPRTLAGRPPVMVPTYPGTERSSDKVQETWKILDDSPNREQDLERLRSLGYIR
ncbi:MAG: alkaline phosphatase family protein [Acidobacteriota bacterium]|nr:alkaline phosphatase family protein [Acidobacteriota bacterium]MDH3783766.1 alkaline phosphatase family protein [Acidobacteriota bacterium]